ncbi:MAG: hypothetical protein KDA42_01755 [Planctomycetales bacterium]|nr:hypothetical protein [Planctomycetales bacterium]
MGLLNRMKQAMGLETAEQDHEQLKTTISYPAKRNGNSNGANGQATRTANGERVAEPTRRASVNGNSTRSNGHTPASASAVAAPEPTQTLTAAGQDTIVERRQQPRPPREKPARREPVEMVGLTFGMDDTSYYEFDDEDDSAELLENGNCRRCWVEDHQEVAVTVDTNTGLHICPECKATYRAEV